MSKFVCSVLVEGSFLSVFVHLSAMENMFPMVLLICSSSDDKMHTNVDKMSSLKVASWEDSTKTASLINNFQMAFVSRMS